MGETEERGEEKRLILTGSNINSSRPIDLGRERALTDPYAESLSIVSGICPAGGAEIDPAWSRRHTQGGKAGKRNGAR